MFDYLNLFGGSGLGSILGGQIDNSIGGVGLGSISQPSTPKTLDNAGPRIGNNPVDASGTPKTKTSSNALDINQAITGGLGTAFKTYSQIAALNGNPNLSSIQKSAATGDAVEGAVSQTLGMFGPWGQVAGAALNLVNGIGGSLMNNNKTAKAAKNFSVNSDVASSSAYGGISTGAQQAKADGSSYRSAGLFGKLTAGTSGLTNEMNRSNYQQSAAANILKTNKQALDGAAASQDMFSNNLIQRNYNSDMWNNGSVQYGKAGTKLNYLSDKITEFKKGGKKDPIHIKKSHEGKFTEFKARTGETTEEALHSKDPHVRKMANFARNAKKWKHQDGGVLQPQDKAYWNGFVDFVDSKGYKGSADLDKKELNLSRQLFGQYQKLHPSQWTYDTFVPKVQNAIAQYRTQALDEIHQAQLKHQQNPSYPLAFQGTDDQFMPGLSSTDGWAGSRTTSYKFPKEITNTYDQNKNLLSTSQKLATFENGGDLSLSGSTQTSTYNGLGKKLGVPINQAGGRLGVPRTTPVMPAIHNAHMQQPQEGLPLPKPLMADNKVIQAYNLQSKNQQAPQIDQDFQFSPDIVGMVTTALTTPSNDIFKDGGKVVIHKTGGAVNVIADGKLHAHKHDIKSNPEFEDAQITTKGIPVVSFDEDGEVTQHAEVERDELILHYDLTKELEALMEDGSESAMIEAGRLLACEIVDNTVDSSNKILENE